MTAARPRATGAGGTSPKGKEAAWMRRLDELEQLQKKAWLEWKDELKQLHDELEAHQKQADRTLLLQGRALREELMRTEKEHDALCSLRDKTLRRDIVELMKRRHCREQKRLRTFALLMTAALALAGILSLIALWMAFQAVEAPPAVQGAAETAVRLWADGAPSGRLPGDDTPATERCYMTPDELAALPQFETGHLDAVTVTFYCNEKFRHICGGGRGIAADGTAAEAWATCAVDPTVIPLGSTVTVDFGDGQAPLLLRANDTGGAVQGACIDICVGSHAQAVALGRKTAAVQYTAQIH